MEAGRLNGWPVFYLANLIPIIVPSETAIRIAGITTAGSGSHSVTFP